MPSYPTTRKELFAAIADRLGENQRLLETTGKPSLQQLKVFWIETNQAHAPSPVAGSPWIITEPHFYTRLGVESKQQNHMWLDAANPRIWYLYTFAPTSVTAKIIESELTPSKGIDRVWLSERFLESIQKRGGYTSRGFGFSFEGILADETAESDFPRFSAKFWLGNHPIPRAQDDFLRHAERTFSKSSLRLGRPSWQGSRGASSLLIEIYARGHMTVTTSDDPEETLGLVNEIGTSYAGGLESLEEQRSRFPRPIEYGFGSELDLERFRAVVESGVGPTRLWLQRYEVDRELHRYTGVDLHTNEIVNLDVAPSYAYLVVQKSGCMNAAPRLLTISSEMLSSKTGMFLEGVEMFA